MALEILIHWICWELDVVTLKILGTGHFNTGYLGTLDILGMAHYDYDTGHFGTVDILGTGHYD